MTQDLIYSGLVAALISSLIGLATALITLRLQGEKEERNWRRDRELMASTDLVTSFQRTVSAAMAHSTEAMLANLVRATSSDPAYESESEHKTLTRLEVAETEYATCRLLFELLSSEDGTVLADRMSDVSLSAGSIARRGADPDSREWGELRERASLLRRELINTVRLQMGSEA